MVENKGDKGTCLLHKLLYNSVKLKLIALLYKAWSLSLEMCMYEYMYIYCTYTFYMLRVVATYPKVRDVLDYECKKQPSIIHQKNIHIYTLP